MPTPAPAAADRLTLVPADAPPPPRPRRGHWALPFVLALGFVGVLGGWLQRSEWLELEEERRQLIGDGLTLQARLVELVQAEQAALQALAAALPADEDESALLRRQQVARGLRGTWQSLTLLDARNRLLAHVPQPFWQPDPATNPPGDAPNDAQTRAPADRRGDRPGRGGGLGPGGGAGGTGGMAGAAAGGGAVGAVGAAVGASAAGRPRAAPAGAAMTSQADGGGLSSHLWTTLPDGRQLVLRLAPAALLRQAVPWWLERRYEPRLVDSQDQLIAGAAAALPPQGRQSHRFSLDPELPDAWLELTTRDARRPWWRTLPAALMAAFVAASAWATALSRRRLREVQEAESRWRTELAWRRAIENSLTVGLRGRDAQGHLVHVNRAFCDLVGYGADELLGRLPPYPYWLPDELEQGMQRSRRNLSGEAPREGYEVRWRHRDGHLLQVMIFEAPLINALGQQVGWMGSVVDVSAHRQAEERERRQADALATQARLTTLGEVASALAHQLNQPLAAIAGYSAGALKALQRDPDTDALVLQALRKLGEQAAEAGRIVQRIRGFLTRRAPQPEPCALAQIVERALALLRRDLRRLGLSPQLDAPATLPPVLADPVLIEQVLINLLRNACDALAERPQPPQLRVQLSRSSPRFVRLDVDDNGPGLAGLGIDVLSAPFHTTKTDGMGMGLAICRSVIEAHHGALEAGVSPLGGARLSFTLPVATAATAPHTTSAAAANILPHAAPDTQPGPEL